MMRFVFEEHVKRSPGCIDPARACRRLHADYIKLIKLLYLADRAALIETGSPITGDRYVSMKFGPVLSNVFEPNQTSESTRGFNLAPVRPARELRRRACQQGGVRSACGVRR